MKITYRFFSFTEKIYIKKNIKEKKNYGEKMPNLNETILKQA